MAKCIGNCVECQLDVDKTTCCAFQVLKQTLLMRKELAQISQRLSELGDLAPAITSSLSDITDAEPDVLGAADGITVEDTTQ